jgi:hypothetical protein
MARRVPTLPAGDGIAVVDEAATPASASVLLDATAADPERDAAPDD